jgi:hypothetical protein
MKDAALKMLWVNCVERLKDRINNRTFWEALEQTRPIIIEGNILIMGLDAQNFNRASSLQQVTNMHAIMEVVSELFNHPLQVRLIEGTTLQDWETTKENDVRIAAMKQASTTRGIKQDRESTGWEGLYEQVARLYVQTPNRSLPQGKARYANDALYSLAEAMDTLYNDNPDEHAERSLARTLERIGNSSDIPASVLAFELERLRAWRKAGMETSDGADTGDQETQGQ